MPKEKLYDVVVRRTATATRTYLVQAVNPHDARNRAVAMASDSDWISASSFSAYQAIETKRRN